MLNRLCRAYGWDNAGVVTAAGLHDKGEIAGRAEFDEARALGKDIWGCRVIRTLAVGR